MDPVEDLKHAVEWYRSVVPVRPDRPGPLAPDPTETERVLSDVHQALRPLMVPPELAWFWTNWGAGALDALFDCLPWPGLTTPRFALDVWQYQRGGEFPGMPRNLFPVAYEAHCYLLADTLPSSEDRPAPLWLYAGDTYQLRYPSLAAMFRTVAMTFESAGTVVPADRATWDVGREALDGQAFDDARRAALAAADLGYPSTEVPVEDQRRWPEAWQVAHGLTPDEMEPRGRTHTVAELVAAAATAPLTARLQGRCRGAFGPVDVDGEWVDIRRFTDATGAIDVLQPAGLQVVGVTGDVLVEVEVETRGPIPAPVPPASDPAVVQRLAAASASNEPERLTAELDALIARWPDLGRLPRIRRMVAVS